MLNKMVVLICLFQLSCCFIISDSTDRNSAAWTWLSNSDQFKNFFKKSNEEATATTHAYKPQDADQEFSAYRKKLIELLKKSELEKMRNNNSKCV